ncbi:GNAT family N-acetyltransferase [Ruegeria sp. HKCCD6228]|uniref:lipid II:glycine glycyltransferase FemX n=1 Tax=unclassified Ruegeria TaxID=2625375 RepID=UPI0014897386|nr:MULTISPECIES: GNAT family N-acetyltransferase [unclassified Ruegeria]NOC94223.1 GNAT family N-acetyltransferase [Ruegeria sp. HKCCD6604]NOD99540.1 GNAT family N-acetyltransferase [Ruegeria sp. HKCCD6228]
MIAYQLSARVLPEEKWPALSASFRDLTLEHSLTYARAAARRIGADVQFLMLTTPDGQPVAAACLRIKHVPGLRRGIAWLAAGPLVQHVDRPDPDAATLRAVLAALRTYAQESGHILRLRFPATPWHDVALLDQLARSEAFLPTDRSPTYRTVVVDCTQDEDTLMRALHGKWRNPLRNALKAGLDLDIVPIAQAADRFHPMYTEVQAAKGFRPDIPPEFYYALEGADFAHEVLFARKDGTDIAAMTLGRAGSNAVYLFGATLDTGRRLNAGHYLMWHSMLRCRDLGLKYFDLGGIDPEANPSVTRYKLRTGGTELRAAGPYEFRPAGASSTLISIAETIHARLKKLRS